MKFSAMIFAGFFMMSVAHADDILKKDIESVLSRILPETEVTVTRITKTPITDLYEVLIGTDVIYMTRDGKYVIQGDLIDLDVRQNLTETVRSDARSELLNAISDDDYIEFKSKNMKDIIYVFTDIDCGYCRKFHRDIPKLNESGVNVRYLAYPRTGVLSETGRQMRNVWCADNKNAAMTKAKNGEMIEKNECDDPLEKQHVLARQLGLRGTPAIYLQNGQMLPGYVPPAEILKRLGR